MHTKKILMASLLSAAMLLSACGGQSAPQSGDPQSGAPQSTGSGTTEETAWVPEGDITIRIPVAAGGSFDTFGRIFAQGIQKNYGTTVMVTNLTGANGGVAAADLNSYDPDPCELMGGNIGMFTVTPLFTPDMAMDLEDFELVGSLVAEEYILYAAPGKTGIESWEDLVEYAKTNPVLVNSQAAGSTEHALVTALMGQQGIEFTSVINDGAAKGLVATVAGDSTVCMGPVSVGRQYIETGEVVPILCFSETPCTEFEGIEVPTAKSIGSDLVFSTNNFLMARKGADPEALAQMYDTYVQWQETDEFKELAANADFVPNNVAGPELEEELLASAAMFEEIYNTYYK